MIFNKDAPDPPIWNIQGREQVPLSDSQHQHVITSLSMSPTEEILAAVTSNTVEFWELHKGSSEDWNFVNSISNMNNVTSIKFSPDGNFLASVGNDHTTMQLWKIDKNNSEKKYTAKSQWQQNVANVTMVTFSPNQEDKSTPGGDLSTWKRKLIATAGDDNVVRLWDLKGRQVAEFNGDWEKTISLSFSTVDHNCLNDSQDDSKDCQYIVAAGNNGTIERWPIRELGSLLKDGCKWLKPYFKSHSATKQEKLCKAYK